MREVPFSYFANCGIDFEYLNLVFQKLYFETILDL